MWVGYCAILPDCTQYRPRMGLRIPDVAQVELYVTAERPGTLEEAVAIGRAAAWAWCWRRVDLIERMLAATTSVYGQEDTTECRNLWPAVLAWPDKQVDDVLALLRGEAATCQG
jgi:hypothetical protein